MLIYGCGSIGLRHAQIAASLGADILCISSQSSLPYPTIKALHELSPDDAFDLAVIATPTSLHAKHLLDLSKVPINKILVEKPLFANLKDLDLLFSDKLKEKTYTAYNLRFHPAVQKMQEILKNKKILGIHLHVGQYLPSWRPQQDYRKNYSAYKELGGGVLRDLSHELDLACFFAGSWKRVVALVGKDSHLDIDSEDNVTVLAEHEACPQVTIHLDYLQNPVRRHIIFILEDSQLCFDFISGILTYNTKEESYICQQNTTYEKQLSAFLSNEIGFASSFKEGIQVLSYIEAIERASIYKEWVCNHL